MCIESTNLLWLAGQSLDLLFDLLYYYDDDDDDDDDDYYYEVTTPKSSFAAFPTDGCGTSRHCAQAPVPS